MLDTTENTDSLAAFQTAIAVLGSIAAVIAGILVALATSTEIGGVTGFLGVGAAILVALRPLPVLDYIKSLDSLPAAAILLFLLGGLVPASLGIAVVPGVSLDDLPTIGAAGLTVWWLVENRARFSVPRVAVPLLAMIVWLVVAWIVIDPTFKVLLIGPGRWSIYAMMVVVGASWFRDAKLRWWLIGVVITLATVQALISIWAYHADWFLSGYFIGIERFRWYQLLYDQVNGRTTGLLGIASNFFGAYTLIPAFASIGVAVHTKQVWLKTAMIATFAVLAYAGILSYTRATLIGLVLGLIGYLVVARPYRLVPAIVAITVVAVIATPIISRFQEGNDRAALVSEARSTILSNAVAGVGSGKYLDDLNGVEEEGSRSVTPHNSFLLQASETGILGGLLLLISVVTLMGAVWGGKLQRRTGPGVMAIAIFAGIGAVLVQTMSNNLLHIPPVATQFWLVGIAGVGFARTAGGRWATFLTEPTLKGRSL